MRLQEFTTRAPTPEPSQALPKDVPEVPGQMTVDECIADAEQDSVCEVTPSGLEIFYQWAPKRLYRIRRADPSMGAREPLEVPSVTTVLNVLDKSGALTWWGQGVGVEGVLELFRRGIVYPGVATNGANLAYSERDLAATKEVVTQLLTEEKLTVNHVKDQAADRGVNIHSALEAWIGAVQNGRRGMPNPVDFPDSEKPYIYGLQDFILAVEDSVLSDSKCEIMVGSLEHLYAGRFDLVLNLLKPVEVVTKTYPKRADKVEEIPAGRVLVDLKTSKKTYPSQFMQLEAYEQASIECGYGETDYRAILHVTAGGKYEFVINKDWQFDDFLAVRKVYSVMHERGRLRNEREVLAELEKLGAKEVT